MLSEKEKEFIRYWEAERDKQASTGGKILRGLPMAMIFGFSIIMLIVAVRLFLPEWSTKISKTSAATFVVVVISVIGIVLFFSYFRMHYIWEMNEQLYKELKHRQAAEL